jgi:hypothetical protein
MVYLRFLYEDVFQKFFRRPAEQVLPTLLTSEPIKQLVADMEAEDLQRRVNLAEQLRTLPERREKPAREAHQRAEEARRELERADAAFRVADVKYKAAMGASYSASAGYENERNALVRALEESADPRIDRFIRACDALMQEVRNVGPKEPQGEDRKKKKFGDYELAHQAMNALALVSTNARALQLAALTPAQVTAELERLASYLAPKLSAAAVQLIAPVVESHQLPVGLVDTALR